MAEVMGAGFGTLSVNKKTVEEAAESIRTSNNKILEMSNAVAEVSDTLIADWNDDVSLNFELAEMTIRDFMNEVITTIDDTAETIDLFAGNAVDINMRAKEAAE